MKNETMMVLGARSVLRSICVGGCVVLCAGAAFAAQGPLLVPDYNRDGKIDNVDRNRLNAGEAFTVWLNDDNDAAGTDDGAEAGDTNIDLNDVPDGEGNDRDCEDDKVNGRCDLLDFFPVLVDMNGMESPDDYTWKLISKSVNVVFTRLKADTAGNFHTKEEKALDDETPLYRAEVTNLTEGVALPNGFLVNGWGVFLIEGAALADGGITLRGTKEGGDPVEVKLDLRVKNVEEMYGWMNLRPEAKEVKNEGEQWKVENSSVRLRLPPSTTPSTDNRHFVLVHGYNTNHEEARGNAAEFYKKLWQSGSDAMFTAVEWKGDQSQKKPGEMFPGSPTFSPNYHVNVENAFAAARPFADACKKLPGEKILVAHSLGNMLISSAIRDYGLDYTKYVMLNAAVAREAYDASAYDEDMVSVLWDDAEEDGSDRASRWYRNFAGKQYDPYEYRRKLAWRGRFANLPRTVNYYSPTDDLLANPANPDLDDFDMTKESDPKFVRELLEKSFSIGGFWSLSEKLKGRPVLIETINGVLTNVFGMAESDVYKCEGGWGENDKYVEGIPFSPTNTHFTPFLDARMKTIGMLDILPAETERLRAQHLADAIPAESFAAGANEVATLENVNEEDFIGENRDWPLYEGEDGEGTRTNLWNHSAFREVAFYHTSKFYASLAAVGKPRVIIDTDLGSSMDDLFTIDLAARMHKAGKLDLMAVMIDRPDWCNPTDDPYGKGEFLTFADRYLASLGFGDLPLGKSMPLAAERIPQHVFNPYWTLIYSNNVTGAGALMPTNRTPEEIATLPDAVTLYRRLLKGAPDKSVVICSTGFLSNLRALIDSGEDYEGDGIYSTGLDLIAAKVKELRIMGGCFDPAVAPEETGGAEYNVVGDPVAAKKVFEQWPSPVVVSPWEVGLKLEYPSKDVLADFPAGTFDPVIRAAYTYWHDPGPDAMNRLWDVMTVLPLTEGETLVPLSEKGGISVDEATGVTTFVPNPSSNRCYQAASNMNATAVMNRFREICRTGNPSVSVVPISPAEPGVDYNGSVLSVEFDGVNLGQYSIEDLRASLTIAGDVYEPDEDSIKYDELGGVLTFTITVPSDKVTAGNAYEGEVKVGFCNETLGENIVYARKRPFVQGRQEQAEPMSDWFAELNLEAPTNYVPATAMPERCLATVETTFRFEAPSEATDEPPATNAVQGAVRIVKDGADGYKFQYYACVGKTNEDSFVRGWRDFNVGGESVEEVKPVLDKEYTVRAEAYYFDDARGGENTLVISVDEEGSNRGMVKQFIGNIINRRGGQGGTTRLNSVEFLGDGEISSLVGNYYTNVVNASLAQIDGGGAPASGNPVATQYATVAEAVAAANGNPIRLLWKASWMPTADAIGQSVNFINKSWLHLDLSGLPANAQAVWSDVDGNNGTLTLELVSADTVVYGTIRTAETGNPVAEAFAVKDGKYVYVGDEAGVAAFIEAGVTEIIDHRGKGMVMPGCTDAHSHYIMKFGLENMKGGILFDLADDKAAVLQKVETAAFAAQSVGKTCIFGFGWNIVALKVNEQLTLAELDAASHGLSTVIFAQGGHHAYCNSECLKRCGIIDGEGNVLITKIDGGLLELDEKGYPTGFADERVTGYLMRMGGINYDEIVDDEMAETSIRASQDLLLSTGYAIALEGWSNMLHPSKLYEAAHRMDTNGTLKLVFPMTYEVEPWQTNMTEQIDCLDTLNKTYGTRHVLPEYLKVFMDGCVESMTGAMITPYTVPPYEYKSFWSVDRLAEITANCNAKGLTVHTHVMGDAAVKETTDAYIQGGDGTHRNCMVHLRHVRQEDYQRFADNNIACSAGFTWHVSSKEMDDLLKNFLDDEYIKHAYPMKSFFEAGVKVSSHSDFPANEPSPQDPFGIMQIALTGLLPDSSEEAFDTDELVTVEQVFQALTLNGAWQLGLENERGSIAVGKWADFVLADQDVFECATTDIGKTKVVSTWFEGEKVYQVENGSKDCPWKIGAEDAEDVIAYTNANGRLEISGFGDMQDFEPSAPWAGDTVTEILVGEGVESIGANAFAGCTGLKVLVLEDEEPPELADGTVLEDVQIFVPAGAEEAYRTAEVWSGLAERIFAVYSRKEEDLVKGRLYEVEYRWWDAQGANEIAEFLAEFLNPNPRVSEEDYLFPYQVLDWHEDIGAIDALEEWLENPFALCTSCRTGNFIGRNFDWAYDDVEECVMRIPAAEGRFASIGIASRFFPEPWQTIFGVEDFLPELTMDGINEKGVAINVNVVPAGDNGATTGTNPGGERLCAGFAVRHVLDAATNAAHAVQILESKDIYSIPFLEFHWMISDSAESYIVECVSNKLVVLKAKDAQPKMANFYVSHSPSLCEYEVLTNAELTAKVHTPHAMGIERYARVSNGLDRVDSVDAMFTNMTNVWYKLKYLPGNEERYWSDLNGAPVPGGEVGQRFTSFDDTYELCVARSNAFKSLQANYVAVTNYEARYGDRAILYDDSLTNQVVHTVHTSLYDLEKRTLRVCVQEDCQSQFDYALDLLWVEGHEITAEQIGVCSWTWHGSMADVLEQMKADGRYNGMQLALAPWLGIDSESLYFGDQEGPEVWDFIKEKIAEGKLNVMSTMINFPGEDYTTLTSITNTQGYMYGVAEYGSTSDASVEHWESNLYYTAEAARLTAELGVKTLTTESGFICIDEDLMFQRVAEICATCRVYGVDFLIESGPQHSQFMTNLLTRLNAAGFHNVGVNFDPGDTALFGPEDPVESFWAMKPWIRMIHAKDCKQSRAAWNYDCVWGDGSVSTELDFGAGTFLTTLNALGYTGNILYERLSGAETLTSERIDEITLAMDRIFAELTEQDGTPDAPWLIGKANPASVTAYTNGTTLVIAGNGAMKDFETVGPWGTDIAAVDFGAQVTNFGANAFAGCTLTTLTMRGNPPALGGNDLSGVTVVVREDAEDKFKAADEWMGLTYGEAMKVCYDWRNVKTLAPFLHEVWFDDYTFDAKGETLAGVEMFSCSSVRNGNFIGRNFDFFLDDKPEFVVHVAANPAKGRLASVAMAMHTGMREDGVTNGQYTASYDLLPNRTLDGINECGVAINQNVVAYDPEVAAGVGKEFTGTNPGAPDLNSSFVTRMVLDRATNAAHAVELIKSYNIFGISVSGDILHYMISDSKETYVVEIITNAVVARHFTMMTNFAINWDNERARALTDADNEVWTMKHYPEPSNLVVSAGHFVDATNELAKYYARHAEGVERFVRLRDHYDEVATFEDMERLMRLAQYSQASTFETQPYWYSDRCSVEMDKELSELGYPGIANTYMLYGLKYYKGEVDPEGLLKKSLDEILEENLMAYERTCLADKDAHRKENSEVWLTVHNTTYDISNRMFRVAVQEDYDHTFDIYLADKPVEPLAPGEALGPYKTAEKATNVAEKAVLEPSAEVAAVLTTEKARADYVTKFGFPVTYKSGEESGWYVEAMLTAAGSNDLARSANTVTTNINLAAIAALVGETTTSMTLMGGITGFYYSLHVGDAVTNIAPDANEKNLDVLCGKGGIGKVTFPEVKKPSDAAGFFTISASP